MIRQYAFILCSLFLSTVSAQSWCPPGAEWTHGIMAFWMEGYLQTTYTGDTVLSGTIGQKLEMVATEYNHLEDTVVITVSSSPTITSIGNGTVDIWSHTEQTWDTLYWFSAVPGQSWRPAHYDDHCDPPDLIVVTDTGRVMIDGVSLRYLELIQTWEDNEYVIGRVVERLGWSHWLTLFPGCMAVEGPGGLRCYSDNEISYTSPTWDYGCMSYTDVVEIRQEEVSIFPNPGIDHFTLQLPHGPHHLTLFDAQGRQVLRQQLSEERPVISTASLPSGIYHIHITDRHGRSSGHRWVKQ